MDDIARGCIEQHVFSMPVTQAHNVSHLLMTETRSGVTLPSFLFSKVLEKPGMNLLT